MGKSDTHILHPFRCSHSIFQNISWVLLSLLQSIILIEYKCISQDLQGHSNVWRVLISTIFSFTELKTLFLNCLCHICFKKINSLNYKIFFQKDWKVFVDDIFLNSIILQRFYLSSDLPLNLWFACTNVYHIIGW